MGRAASIRAENLGWNRTAAITLETYHAAVEEKLAGRPVLAVSTSATAASVAAP
jgi:D-inositol-3-phosphate glycosyltransferase